MTLFSNIPDKSSFKNPVVTIGNFDGVHAGHRKILEALRAKAEHVKGDPLVVTFEAHPKKILNPDNAPKIITTTDEKIRILTSMGFANIILLNFTKAMANMNASDFYNHLLVGRLGVKEIVIGYDHAFGKNREGNMDFLLELARETGIGVTRVDEEIIDGKPVSSTWLRHAIMAGNFIEANRLLTWNYSLSGMVVQGAGRGRILGFPTANIRPDDPDKIIPADGVYAVTVRFENGGTRHGMLNIGNNPTFENMDRSIEVNIFDFSDDIYGKPVTVEFHRKLRDEVRFRSAEELIEQIKKDRDDARAVLKNI